MLEIDNTAFVLVDVQGQLAQIVHEKDALFENLRRLIKGLQILNIPILWTEQNPDKMGPTIPELRDLLKASRPVCKMSFSCLGDETFAGLLERLKREQVVLAGIETHVCIYQTAADLLQREYHVEVVADAVSSRTAANKAIGLEKIRACGGHVTSVETLLFRLLRTAEHPAFRKILAIVK
ncbi:MAG: hydrolase [Verrucomicrobiota bacterium]|nr:hydrolase [Verrucomicrobiota bacterium]